MTVAPSGYLYPPDSPAEPLGAAEAQRKRGSAISSWWRSRAQPSPPARARTPASAPPMMARLTNMRLGYWWERNRHARRIRPPSKPVQSYLLREMRATYEGTSADRWYLSDGGHYEIPASTSWSGGASLHHRQRQWRRSLLRVHRRREPDPQARIDFEAEVEFVDEASSTACSEARRCARCSARSRKSGCTAPRRCGRPRPPRRSRRRPLCDAGPHSRS